MSKSILGLKRTIPDHYRCHSHQKRRKSDKNRLSFHEKKWPLSRQINNLAISALTSRKTRSFTCKTNKLICFRMRMENLECL